MGADWVMDVESNVYSKVRARTMTKLKKEFPNIKFTTEDENGNETKFPTVYIHLMDAIPQGDDLQAESINGVLATFEVRVTTNTDKDDATEVMRHILNAFVDLKFRVVTASIPSKRNDNYVSSSRFRRTIGASETIDF